MCKKKPAFLWLIFPEMLSSASVFLLLKHCICSTYSSHCIDVLLSLLSIIFHSLASPHPRDLLLLAAAVFLV